MEMSGYHTPKRTLRKPNQNVLYIPNNSPIKSIKRRKSFIPFSIFKSFQNNYEDSKTIKKSSKINFSGNIIPEEQEENKNRIRSNIKSDTFSNLINDIYANEAHLNKNIVSGTPRILNGKIQRNKISNKTLFKAPSKRMGSINSLSLFNKMKNKDKPNKDGLTINSYYNIPKNDRKLFEKIDNLIHKKEKDLTKNDKEVLLNFFDKSKDIISSPKHKINKYNSTKSPKSPKSPKRKKKNNNVKLREKNKPTEDEKTEKEKAENEENGNTVLPELKDNPSKIGWFKAFLCCLESN